MMDTNEPNKPNINMLKNVSANPEFPDVEE
jgi:hypothetical protein